MNAQRNFLVGVILLIITGLALAVPATRDLLSSSSVNIPFNYRLIGDEFVHWSEAEDGHTILMNDDGEWRYARISAHGELRPTGPEVRGHHARGH